jgi:small conductance mechanosensitive channel
MMQTLLDAVRRYADEFVVLALQYVPHVVLALIVLVVGLKLIKIITGIFSKALQNERVDPSFRGFFESVTGIVLKIMLFISVAAMIGVQTTSFVALIGAIGLAIGLSLQGSLSNLAGGILILFFKPFVVGERIQAQNQEGAVQRIEIFSTVVKGDDGRTIIIPNGILSNGVIVNHSRK